MKWLIKFKDKKHEEGFKNLMTRANVQIWDKERTSLFYILALFHETRVRITNLYDFDENCIKIEGLYNSWQTGNTVKATKLAFNLFNNFRGEERENYSPLELFSIEHAYRNYMLLAVQIRFS